MGRYPIIVAATTPRHTSSPGYVDRMCTSNTRPCSTQSTVSKIEAFCMLDAAVLTQKLYGSPQPPSMQIILACNTMLLQKILVMLLVGLCTVECRCCSAWQIEQRIVHNLHTLWQSAPGYFCIPALLLLPLPQDIWLGPEATETGLGWT